MTRIIKAKDFDLKQTLECGQCFNFEEISCGEYIVIAFERALHVRQKGCEIEFLNARGEDIDNIWIPYFDLDRDYGKIKDAVCGADERLRPVTEKYFGIRILNQEPFETLISFILSQNNNIKRIKGLIRALSEKYGHKIDELCGRKYYSFPSPDEWQRATEDELRGLRTGFRAPYIIDAVRKLESGKADLENLRNMSCADAKAKLMEIKGVGSKVADCVLLFGLGFRAAFPVDVWIKRIMEKLYFGKETPKEEIERFAAERFGKYGGYAQQYLYVYARENRI